MPNTATFVQRSVHKNPDSTPCVMPRNCYGVGSQMARMFSWFLIRATKDCPCCQHAHEYDAWGPDECLHQIPLILSRLAEQAAERKLPFVPILATQLVCIAVKRARRGKPL